MNNDSTNGVSYTKKVISGIGIVFLMNAFVALIAYVIRIVLARSLGPKDYGLFSAVFTFVLFFIFFRDMGLNTALVKFIADFNVKNKFDQIKSTITSLFLIQGLSSLFFAILFFLLSGILAVYYFKDPRASLLLKILVAYLFTSILFTSLKSIYAGFQKLKYFAIVDFIKNMAILAFIAIFLFINLGVYAPTIAYVLAGPVVFLVLLPLTLKVFPFFRYKIKSFASINKSLVLFGLPLMVVDIGYKIIGYIDVLMLTYFRSLDEVGIYNVILPSAIALLFLGSAISNVVFPVVSELWAKKDKKRIRDGLKLINKYLFAALVPLIFTIFAFAGFFIDLFFGADYTRGTLALQILLVGVLFFLIGGTNNGILVAIGRPKTVTKIIILAAIMNFIANIMLIPFFGMNGAAASTSVSYFVIFCMSFYKINRFMGVKFQNMLWIKMILSAAVFILSIFLIKNMLNLNTWTELIISATAASLIYLISLWVLKILDKTEISKTIMLLRKKSRQ